MMSVPELENVEKSALAASETFGSEFSLECLPVVKPWKLNGNYSHAIRSANTLHISGRMGDDPTTGGIVSGGIQPQTVINALDF
jgi:enamine deaminase RidA (YjgF/YER057c/UK114 family)